MSSIVAANEDLYTGRYNNCMDQSGGVTVNMLDCIGEELNSQDARLNGAYKQLRSQLTSARRQSLLDAQRLWIKYRDANCNFYADPEGGTFANLLASECVLRETAERAKELEELGNL
jgi:uncharacterized protein YecT (DUF1311 family)